jgi:hypothetical protein
MRSVMQNTAIKSAVKFILVVGLGVAAVEGCGSSSSPSSTDPVALCTQACQKLEMCLLDASASSSMSQCMSQCSTAGAGGASGQGTTCTNASQIETAYNACLKMDCSQIVSCLSSVPQCQTSGTGTGGTTGAAGATGKGGTSGAAGATGSGGTSGAAGASGAADCSICDKANTCCMALATIAGQPTSSCTYSTAMCNSTASSGQSSYITICQDFLTSGAAVSASCR